MDQLRSIRTHHQRRRTVGAGQPFFDRAASIIERLEQPGISRLTARGVDAAEANQPKYLNHESGSDTGVVTLLSPHRRVGDLSRARRFSQEMAYGPAVRSGLTTSGDGVGAGHRLRPSSVDHRAS